MDRQRGHLIAFGAALACFAASALAQVPWELREAGWLSNEGQLEALSSEPTYDRGAVFQTARQSELAAQYPSEQALQRDLLVGEFLFRTPLLLGGQAARAGLSCNSCHVNGRSNPHFKFPAISGDPGTADTTHNFFSETLGNNVHDPVPIPDLTEVGKVSHDPATGTLEAFLRTIVIEEFSGPAQSQVHIRPLASFVRALQLSNPTPERRERSVQRDWDGVMAMVSTAMEEANERNYDLAALLLSGARTQMAAIHARLIPREHDAERDWLIRQSRILAQLQRSLIEDEPVDAEVLEADGAWHKGLATTPNFADLQEYSLYNRERLSPLLEQ